MNISIDLGNLWEMLSAIGTIAAVVVSLILALKEKDKRIVVTITTDKYFGHNYIITLYKNPMDDFVLKDIGYKRFFIKKSIKEEFKSGFEIMNFDEVGQDHKQFPFSFSSDSQIKISLRNWNYTNLINKKVRFYVKDNNGKYHQSNKFKILDVSKKAS